MTNVTQLRQYTREYEDALDRICDIVIANSEGKSASRRERLRQVVLSLTKSLVEIAQRPDEPDGDVVRFTKRFRGDSKLYDYVAVKAGGHWYLSCRDRRNDQPLTWDELLDFAYDSYGSQLTLRVAEDWLPVFEKN